MTKDSRFEALDAWRGICAILIVVFHFTSAIHCRVETSIFIGNAYLFVDFFFVLSGFVLCHCYRQKIADQGDIVRFAIKRFGRVWPLHAVVLLIFFAAIATIGLLPHPKSLAMTWNYNDYAVRALLPEFLLLNAMGLQSAIWNGPAWSIGAEFYTYLIFALIVLFAGRRLILPCLIISIAALTFIFCKAPDLMNATWDYGIVRCLAGFFGGVAAYHCFAPGESPRFLRGTFVELGAVALVIVFIEYAGNGADAVSAISLAAPLVFGLVVVVFAREQGFLSLLLRARPFHALGRYSFSIYMIHMPMLILLCYGGWLSGYETKALPDAAMQAWPGSTDILLADFVLAVVLISAASYRFVEMPARKYLNRLAGKPGLFDGLSEAVITLARRLGVADHALDRG
jgi:peptidoglycan/LPS O-acetylase OafA/YrhL